MHSSWQIQINRYCTTNDSTACIMAKLTNQSNFYNSWALETPVLTLIRLNNYYTQVDELLVSIAGNSPPRKHSDFMII